MARDKFQLPYKLLEYCFVLFILLKYYQLAAFQNAKCVEGGVQHKFINQFSNSIQETHTSQRHRQRGIETERESERDRNTRNANAI